MQPRSHAVAGMLPGAACLESLERANQSDNFELETHWRMLVIGGGAGEPSAGLTHTRPTTPMIAKRTGRQGYCVSAPAGTSPAVVSLSCTQHVLSQRLHPPLLTPRDFYSDTMRPKLVSCVGVYLAEALTRHSLGARPSRQHHSRQPRFAQGPFRESAPFWEPS